MEQCSQIDFQQIVEKYAPSLYRLAYNFCLNQSDAEDVVQDVFLKYLEHTPQYSEEKQLRAWLMTTTVNKCKDLLRSGWRRKTTTLEDSYAQTDHIEEVLEVRSAIAKLSPKLRIVVNLFYFEQMSVKQISDMLHLSETAVHSRLHKARKQLKAHLGGD